MSDANETITLDGEEDEIIIQEEGEEALKPKADEADADDDSDGDDERLNSEERDGETVEERRERRRAEKQVKKQNRRAYQDQNLGLIEALTEQNRVLAEQVAKIQGHMVKQDSATVEQSHDHWVRRAESLRRARAKAVAEGDGDAFERFDREFNQAAERANHFYNLRQQPIQAPKPVTEGTLHPVQAKLMEEFLDRHDWYDPTGRDPQSRKVSEIDAGVARDGFDPTKPAYWMELERRMKSAKLAVPADVEDEPARNERGQFQGRRGPAVGGKDAGAKPKGGTTIVVTREMKQTLVDAGMWDDPAKRNKVLRQMHQNMQAKK